MKIKNFIQEELGVEISGGNASFWKGSGKSWNKMGDEERNRLIEICKIHGINLVEKLKALKDKYAKQLVANDVDVIDVIFLGDPAKNNFMIKLTGDKNSPIGTFDLRKI
jgi:hypothetical protein